VSQSRFVNPSAAPLGYYNEPPGVAQRPNALRVNVYLPPGYRAHPRRRYPVLYLLHGHGDAYDSWVNPAQGDLLKTAAGFGGIVVMPEGDHGWYTNWWNGGARGNPAWERYHLDQLIGVVERRLRIRKARRWHAIAGLSMGGEGAVYYASQRPGYFGSVASFSGVLSIQRPEYQLAFDRANGDPSHEIWGDPQAQSFYWRGHNPLALTDNLRSTRVYVSVGNGVPDPTRPGEVRNQFGQVAEAELRQQANQFVAKARATGVRVTYHRHQGIHDWRYWRQDLQHAIAWGLFARPPRAHGQWIYRTVAQTGRMWSLGFRFQRPPPVVETFARSGDTLAADGSGTVTLRPPGGCTRTLEVPFRVQVPRCGTR
jgi:S-formylglutathione hydrolase FrmB